MSKQLSFSLIPPLSKSRFPVYESNKQRCLGEWKAPLCVITDSESFSFLDKESASTVALYSTSTGFMSSTRGVSHADRARLALMLEARHMGELPPREVAFKQAISHIITSEETWWTSYLGRVGYLITRLYPARKIDETKPRVILSGDWAWNLGKKKDKEGLRLTVSIQKVEHDPSKLKRALKDHGGVVQKVGKKKNWAGGENGWGMKVEVRVVEEDIVAL